jgi:hypothetical protein
MKSIQASKLKGFVCHACRHRLSQSRRGFASVTRQREIYDVVTVGGGPVGLALLAALSIIYSILLHNEPVLIVYRIFSDHQWSQGSTS